MNRFHSALAEQMQQFVAFKRMQGCDYTDQARKLSYFDRFLVAEFDGGALPLEIATLQRYVEATANLETFSQYTRLTALREFSRYLHARLPQSAILPKDILPRREPTVRFYPIAPEEVAALMNALASVLPPDSIRTHAVRTLIGLLYATGLRISEALSLTLGDIDAPRAIAHVTKGKFGKQRLVPLSPSTLTALDDYLAVRNVHAATVRSAPLFISTYNKALTYSQAYDAFRRVCQNCGLLGKPPPRFHDLRHNYACRRLALWRKEGKDVNAMLPVLATAMGHVNIFHTQIYLHIEAGELREAATRLRNRIDTHLENIS
jgi:integrase